MCIIHVFRKWRAEGEEESRPISNMTSFLENIYLNNFFPCQAKLTSLIERNAQKTSWKINSGVFEIPEWICQGCLA